MTEEKKFPFVKYPSIEQFRHCIKEIMWNQTVGPVVTFTGTVKLHGTNAGISTNGEDVWFQSRKRVLTVTQDNAGFNFWGQTNIDHIKALLTTIQETRGVSGLSDENVMTVFGEWCGQGIQSGVAISQLDRKIFVIFGIKVGDTWIDSSGFFDNDVNIYNISEFPQYTKVIDFSVPEASTNELVEITNKVEEQCPVGKHFNIDGTGEGVVWSAEFEGNFFRFKVKGERHSISKVKTLAEVDPVKLKQVNDFVEYAVTPNRLYQGIAEVFGDAEPDIKGIGKFINWVKTDCIKEELDVLVENGLDPKEIIKPIQKKASEWFRKNYYGI